MHTDTSTDGSVFNMVTSPPGVCFQWHGTWKRCRTLPGEGGEGGEGDSWGGKMPLAPDTVKCRGWENKVGGRSYVT